MKRTRKAKKMYSTIDFTLSLAVVILVCFKFSTTQACIWTLFTLFHLIKGAAVESLVYRSRVFFIKEFKEKKRSLLFLKAMIRVVTIELAIGIVAWILSLFMVNETIIALLQGYLIYCIPKALFHVFQINSHFKRDFKRVTNNNLVLSTALLIGFSFLLGFHLQFDRLLWILGSAYSFSLFWQIIDQRSFIRGLLKNRIKGQTKSRFDLNDVLSQRNNHYLFQNSWKRVGLLSLIILFLVIGSWIILGEAIEVKNELSAIFSSINFNINRLLSTSGDGSIVSPMMAMFLGLCCLFTLIATVLNKHKGRSIYLILALIGFVTMLLSDATIVFILVPFIITFFVIMESRGWKLYASAILLSALFIAVIVEPSNKHNSNRLYSFINFSQDLPQSIPNDELKISTFISTNEIEGMQVKYESQSSNDLSEWINELPYFLFFLPFLLLLHLSWLVYSGLQVLFSPIGKILLYIVIGTLSTVGMMHYLISAEEGIPLFLFVISPLMWMVMGLVSKVPFLKL